MDRADLAIKMSKLVHDKCKDVPYDIGLQLLYLIEEYEGALRQPPVVGRSEQFYCNCSRAKGLDHDEEGMPYCIDCQKPVQ